MYDPIIARVVSSSLTQTGERPWHRGDSKCDDRGRMQFLKGA
jgi:hypothetical protein